MKTFESLREILQELQMKKEELVSLEEEYRKNTEIVSNEITHLEKMVDATEKSDNPMLVSAFNKLHYLGKPEVFFAHSNWYLQEFVKSLVTSNPREYNLEFQDNSYGGDSRLYLTPQRKYTTRSYHPCLFSIAVGCDITDDELDSLIYELKFTPVFDENYGKFSYVNSPTVKNGSGEDKKMAGYRMYTPVSEYFNEMLLCSDFKSFVDRTFERRTKFVSSAYLFEKEKVLFDYLDNGDC